MKKVKKYARRREVVRAEKYKEGYLLMLDFILGKKQIKVTSKQNQTIKTIK